MYLFFFFFFTVFPRVDAVAKAAATDKISQKVGISHKVSSLRNRLDTQSYRAYSKISREILPAADAAASSSDGDNCGRISQKSVLYSIHYTQKAWSILVN